MRPSRDVGAPSNSGSGASLSNETKPVTKVFADERDGRNKGQDRGNQRPNLEPYTEEELWEISMPLMGKFTEPCAGQSLHTGVSAAWRGGDSTSSGVPLTSVPRPESPCMVGAPAVGEIFSSMELW